MLAWTPAAALIRRLGLAPFCAALWLAGCAQTVAPVRPPENYAGPIAEAPASQSADSWTYELPDGRKFKGSASGMVRSSWVHFPLWVGKTWSFESEVTRISGTLHPIPPERADNDCKVTAFEKLAVKAGAFDAFACKCVCELVIKPLIFSEYCGTVTIWYAPAVGNVIRVKTEDTATSYELAEYKLSKKGLEPSAFDPKNAEDFTDRGDAYFDRKDYDHAIEDYDRAIQLDPKYALAFFNRARAYAEKREYGRAIQDYTQSIQLNPKDAAAFNNRGNIHRDQKEYDRAIEDYEQALRLNSQYALALNNRGILYRSRKEDDRAIQDYNEAIRLSPGYAAPFNNRGNVYRDRKEYDRAIQDYDEAIRLNPSDATALNNRALAYRLKQDYERSLADYEAAARADPKLARHKLTGYALFYLGRTAESAEAMDRAVKAAPQDMYAVLWRHIAVAKDAGLGAASRELVENGARLKESRWPAPVIDFYLGKIDEKALFAAAENLDPQKKPERICEANFYAAEAKLLNRSNAEAIPLLRAAATECPPTFYEAHGARTELKRLGMQ